MRLAALIAGVSLFYWPIAYAEKIECRVVGITDGDTLTCLSAERRQIKVRLAQIDAPERAQPFGQRSKRALSELVFSRNVVLDVESTDRYRRSVATVIVAGKDINLEMVRTGMAWAYDRYVHDPRYFVVQRNAKDNRVGLWADKSPIRPSEWRRVDHRG